MSSYGTSPTRCRRSREEIGRLDAALAGIAYEMAPATVRQAFYQAVSRGLVPTDEAKGYRVVQRRLLELREGGTIPHGLITDNARLVGTLPREDEELRRRGTIRSGRRVFTMAREHFGSTRPFDPAGHPPTKREMWADPDKEAFYFPNDTPTDEHEKRGRNLSGSHDDAVCRKPS